MTFEHIPFAVIGISHHTAPVEVRELAALSSEEQEAFLQEITALPHTLGAMVLSTCNRTEIYLSSEHVEDSVQAVRTWMRTRKNNEHLDTEHAYIHRGYEAVVHFMRVISSLDSQIVGETQITGQVKDAYTFAADLGATDSLLNKIFYYGILAQKKVRSNTYLCQGAVSISFAGVELAEKIFSDLETRSVLVVGAGETADLSAEHFRKKGVSRFNIVNRTFENAQTLANRFGGEPFVLEELEAALAGIDIVISATASQDVVLSADLVRHIIRSRKNSPLFLIDLAIPRDIDPAVDELDSVYLYNLDDLQDIVAMNSSKRQSEIPKAEKIVQALLMDFDEWYATYSMSSTIRRLKAYFEQLLENEIRRVEKNTKGDSNVDLDELRTNLANRLIRQHVKLLKKGKRTPHQETHLEFIHQLFELD